MADLDQNAVTEVTLKNQGGFVVKMEFKVKKDLQDERLEGSGKDILIKQSETIDPGQYGVKEKDEFRLLANVQLGKDKESAWMQYSKEAKRTAKFVISGTTLDNDLAFVGFE